MKLAADERRPAAMVLNRVPASSRQRDIVTADLAARGIPLLRATIGNRTAFVDAFAAGLGVTESAPRSSAAQEIRALVGEILEKVG